jgi:hypothetical protein
MQADAEAKSARTKQRQLAAGKPVAKISEVGVRGEGGIGLACPRCGATGFKARRSKGARAGIVTATVVSGGIAGLGAAAVTKQKQVTCIACGARYQRG